MSSSSKVQPRRSWEWIMGPVSVGFFFVLVGIIFVITPNIFSSLITFFSDFNVVRVHNFPIYLLAPTDPRAHLVVYSAVEKFSLGWGVFQFAVLIFRFAVRSPRRKKAENLGNVIFWVGAAYLVQTMLVEVTRWFEFWVLILVVLGISLVGRAIFLAATIPLRRDLDYSTP